MDVTALCDRHDVPMVPFQTSAGRVFVCPECWVASTALRVLRRDARPSSTERNLEANVW